MAEINQNKKKSRYIFSLLDEDTLQRKWVVRLTKTTIVCLAIVAVVLILGLYTVLVTLTPLRVIFPKNTDEFRQELVDQAMRIDSLQTVIEVQTAYLESMRGVLAGQVSVDTVLPLDSMQLIAREQLLEAKSQVTEDWQAEYEARDNFVVIESKEEGVWKE